MGRGFGDREGALQPKQPCTFDNTRHFLIMFGGSSGGVMSARMTLENNFLPFELSKRKELVMAISIMFFRQNLSVDSGLWKASMADGFATILLTLRSR
jgi:hypothetical protein